MGARKWQGFCAIGDLGPLSLQMGAPRLIIAYVAEQLGSEKFKVSCVLCQTP